MHSCSIIALPYTTHQEPIFAEWMISLCAAESKIRTKLHLKILKQMGQNYSLYNCSIIPLPYTTHQGPTLHHTKPTQTQTQYYLASLHSLLYPVSEDVLCHGIAGWYIEDWVTHCNPQVCEIGVHCLAHTIVRQLYRAKYLKNLQRKCKGISVQTQKAQHYTNELMN